MRTEITAARERFNAMASNAPGLAFLGDLFDLVSAQAMDLSEADFECFVAQSLRDEVRLRDVSAHVAYACAVLTALLKQHVLELRGRIHPLTLH